MAIGDSPEMQRMQEEAMQRAREMYLRANPQAAQQTAQAQRQTQPAQTGTSAPPAQTAQRQSQPTQAACPAVPNQPQQRQTNPRAVPAPQGGGRPPLTQAPAPVQRTETQLQTAPSAPSILNTLMEDKDRTLILMLLVLLSGEGQSNELMFALLFLLI